MGSLLEFAVMTEAVIKFNPIQRDVYQRALKLTRTCDVNSLGSCSCKGTSCITGTWKH